jgi:hypothetical protein
VWVFHEHAFEKADARMVFESHHHGDVFVVLIDIARTAPFHGFGESMPRSSWSSSAQVWTLQAGVA